MQVQNSSNSDCSRRVAVRLHHGHHIARAGLPRRLQHRGDFHRMVAVIVDHGDAAGLAGLGEAPLDAAEGGERAAQRRVVDLHLGGDGDGGQRVLHVVAAQHRQAERPHAGAAGCGARSVTITSKVAPIRSGRSSFGAHIGLRREPVGDDATVRQPRDHLLHRRMVDAQHREPIERDVGDELVDSRRPSPPACPSGRDARGPCW